MTEENAPNDQAGMCTRHDKPERWVVDPYQADIDGVIEYMWLCEDCEQNRADDI